MTSEKLSPRRRIALTLATVARSSQMPTPPSGARSGSAPLSVSPTNPGARTSGLMVEPWAIGFLAMLYAGKRVSGREAPAP